MSNPFTRLFLKRQTAYRGAFHGPDGDRVLADLRRFCFASMPTADPENPNVTYIREGRREVWLRISNFLNITDEQLYQLTEEAEDE